jgi:hypothetical protein
MKLQRSSKRPRHRTCSASASSIAAFFFFLLPPDDLPPPDSCWKTSTRFVNWLF